MVTLDFRKSLQLSVYLAFTSKRSGAFLHHASRDHDAHLRGDHLKELQFGVDGRPDRIHLSESGKTDQKVAYGSTSFYGANPMDRPVAYRCNP